MTVQNIEDQIAEAEKDQLRLIRELEVFKQRWLNIALRLKGVDDGAHRMVSRANRAISAMKSDREDD